MLAGGIDRSCPTLGDEVFLPRYSDIAATPAAVPRCFSSSSFQSFSWTKPGLPQEEVMLGIVIVSVWKGNIFAIRSGERKLNPGNSLNRSSGTARNLTKTAS